MAKAKAKTKEANDWEELNNYLHATGGANLGKIKEWMKAHPTFNTPPNITTYHYTQKPEFGSYTLWYDAAKISSEASNLFRQYFGSMSDAYWIRRDNCPPKTFGIVDGLLEEGLINSAFNFMLSNDSKGYTKITNKDSIAKMFNSAIEDKKYDGRLAVCMSLLAVCDMEVFQKLPIKETNALLESYFSRYGNKAKPFFSYKQAFIDKEDKITDKIKILQKQEIITPQQALFLATQFNVNTDYLDELLELNKPTIKSLEKPTGILKFKSFFNNLIDTQCHEYLHNAIVNRAWKTFEYLLSKEFDPQQKNSSGYTPIQLMLSNVNVLKEYHLLYGFNKEDFINFFSITHKYKIHIFDELDNKNIFALLLGSTWLNDQEKEEVLNYVGNLYPPDELAANIHLAIKYLKKENENFNFELGGKINNFLDKLKLIEIVKVKAENKIHIL